MDIERLIEQVRKFPVLYDQSHEQYRNTVYTDRIWTAIASTLRVAGGGDDCKKRWFQIRDQMRKTLRKRKNIKGSYYQNYKYRYEDLLDFVIPHIGKRKRASKTSYSKEDEDKIDESVTTQYIQEQSTEEESEKPEEDDLKIAVPIGQSSVESSSISAEERRNQKPYPKKNQESVLGQLMTYILTEKEAEKEKINNQISCSPVEAFLAGIAPSLKMLNPVLLNQAKSSIFAIVQELEMKQLTED